MSPEANVALPSALTPLLR